MWGYISIVTTHSGRAFLQSLFIKLSIKALSYSKKNILKRNLHDTDNK